MSKLSTHVLDTAHGRPAANMQIDLLRVDGDTHHQRVKSIRTNRDGRTDTPLLSGPSMATGTYELRFFVRDYFASLPGSQQTSPFLDIVPVRFTIFDETESYHVPLLVSPWSYSTYRGS